MTPPHAPPPLEMPRQVMRAAAAVAAVALLLAFGLGFWHSRQDIDEEITGALALAASLARIIESAALQDDATLRATLRRPVPPGQGPLRHVSLQVHDAQGALVLDTRARDEPVQAAGPVAWLASLHARWRGELADPPRALTLARPAGPPWQLQVTPARDSERLEAMASLAQSTTLLALGSAAMLGVMALTLRRGFAPLRSLVRAIGLLREQPAQAAATLAEPMPTQELQVVAQALLSLQQAQARDAQAAQVLRRQVLTLQEDERQRLARELHDEFGQHLTALRVDAAWLAQRLATLPDEARVAQGMAQRCSSIQQDIRALLTRLQPLAPAAGADEATEEPASRLAELLAALMGGWAGGADRGCSFELRLVARQADGRAAPWPRPGDPTALPRELALALYRMSQEALTNVARHAGARRAVLSLTLHLAAAGSVAAVDWAVADDGIGLPGDPLAALLRGSGLAGVKERAWAHGAELQLAAASPGAARPGLRLSARFELENAR